MIPSPNPPGTRAVVQATERHILCVDDDLEFLKSLEFFLPDQVNQDAGGLWYRFVFLTDPHEALEALTELVEERESVAMLISDQKMPAMKGTEFFAQARRISAGSVRVLLTAHAGLEAAIAAINEQLLDKYLTKPIENQHDFAVSIRHLLQRFEMQQRIQAQSKVIRDLYDFANTLHTMDGLRGTLVTFRDLFGDRAFLGYALASGLGIAAVFCYISGASFVFQDIYGASPQAFAIPSCPIRKSPAARRLRFA